MSDFRITLDPATRQALAESGRRMHDAIGQFVVSVNAAMETIAPMIVTAAEQMRQKIIAATERTKTP